MLLLPVTAAMLLVSCTLAAPLLLLCTLPLVMLTFPRRLGGQQQGGSQSAGPDATSRWRRLLLRGWDRPSGAKPLVRREGDIR